MSCENTAPLAPITANGVDLRTHPIMRWLLLVTVGMGVFLITLDNTVLYTALPTLVAELRATNSQMLWIMNAYPVVVSGLLLGTGTLGDKIGHRTMLSLGLAIFGVGSIAAAFAPDAAVLILARGVLAIGAACMMPSTLALIRLTFQQPRELALAISLWAMLAVLASALGPLIGGILLEWFWWGSVFVLNLPFVLAALCAIPFVAPRTSLDRSKHWDFYSSFLACLALMGTVLFIKELVHSPQNWRLIGGAVVVSVLGWFLFTRRQSQLPEPLISLDIFRNPVFVAGTIGASFAMFGMVGLQFIITQKAQLVDGLTPLESGLLVTISAAGSALTSLIAGAKLHIIGARLLVAGGMLVAVAGTVAVMFGAAFHWWWAIIVGLFVVGAGLGGVTAVASMLIVSNAPPHRAGMASSVEEVSYEMGSLIAVAVLGSLLSFIYSVTLHLPSGAPARAHDSLQDALMAMTEEKMKPEVASALVDSATASYEYAFVACTALVAAVLFLGFLLTNTRLKGYKLPEEESSKTAR
ncbi:MFS transporter [Corynebacterium anserum]|nr:MFS transporter [Corynebacterium anserum]